MISSLDNKKVKEWTKLHNKKYRGEEFLLLDEKSILAAKENNLLKTLIYVDELPFEFNDAYEVNQEVMNKISKEDNKKYIGIGLPLKENNNYQKRVMILEDLQDPLNIGRIIEGCYLFGFDSIVLTNNSADIYNSKCLKAAGEAFYKVNIYHGDVKEEIKKLKENNFKVYATGLKDYSLEMYDVKKNDKMAFILGNEGSGVKEETMNISDEVIKIDMHNIDSLNVAMAGAIIMYRFSI